MVAFPRDEEDVAAMLEWCTGARGRFPSVAVGGVEPVVGDAYPGTVSIDIRLLDRVHEVDRSSLAARIQANDVDTQHCVTATVKDASANPTPSMTVPFTVSGSVSTSGSETTDANGQATFLLPRTTPAALALDLRLRPHRQQQGSRSERALGHRDQDLDVSKLDPLCKITRGGGITADNGDSAKFDGTAQATPAATSRAERPTRTRGLPRPCACARSRSRH